MQHILVIGGTGTIGSAVVDQLSDTYEPIPVGHTSGDYQVDLADKSSVNSLIDEVGPVEHVICAAGVAEFGPLDELTDDDFQRSLDNKLMGQINLVRLGHEFVRNTGSITLTSGVLATQPIEGSCAISTVNAGLEGFVRAAALDLAPGGPRINVVSPPWVAETLAQMGRDPADGVPADTVAATYIDALEGEANGEVITVE